MSDNGWIKIYRSSLDHWLFTEYRPLTRQEAWIRILFTVNYEPAKLLIRGQLHECGRGQSLLSLNSWAEMFVWSVKQVRTFFMLLEKDGMIKIEGLQYTTRLTVCNYEYYQDKGQTAGKPKSTIKEEEGYKEGKEYNIPQEKTARLTVCNYEYYQDKGQTEGKPRADGGQTEGKPRATIKEEEEYKESKEYNIPQENLIAVELNEWAKPFFNEKYLGDKSYEVFEKLIRLDGYSPEDIKKAIIWARGDDWWTSNFISPVKLRNKDKSGVKYIDVFLAKILKNGTNRSSNNGQQRDLNELANILQKHIGA